MCWWWQCRLARYECGIAAKSASIYCICTVASVPPKTDGIAVKCVTFSLGPLGCGVVSTLAAMPPSDGGVAA